MPTTTTTNNTDPLSLHKHFARGEESYSLILSGLSFVYNTKEMEKQPFGACRSSTVQEGW